MMKFRVIDVDKPGIRVRRNMPSVWVIDLLGRRVLYRSYPAHRYLIVGRYPNHRIVFDWWPKDQRNRLVIFGRTVRFMDPAE